MLNSPPKITENFCYHMCIVVSSGKCGTENTESNFDVSNFCLLRNINFVYIHYCQSIYIKRGISYLVVQILWAWQPILGLFHRSSLSYCSYH